ncbi:Hsp20/alpha crystallin family protein [Xanthobacter agilis]|jgi:HSP20 family protein|uniref:HSP20 family protein n=1 Tax=Xanthobacter agilis TaxID=47492 RepID=A0ABU0LIY9_XANAG|nr:Hsp20/alpha crystallin family protein [Xanthobacter agilis]MDQ0507099.1 HSP20 family protein [Xanthobacter agilis]
MTRKDKDQDNAPHTAAGAGPDAAHKAEAMADLGAVFRGLGGFVEMLGTLVEKAEDIQQQGEFKVKGLGDQARGVYGFSVRTGIGGIPQVRRFGNLNTGAKGPVVDDVREPLVDVFDEAKEVIVTAEIPGVAENEITLSLEGQNLSLATTGRHRYAKTIALPGSIDPASLERSHRNGILQVKLRKV